MRIRKHFIANFAIGEIQNSPRLIQSGKKGLVLFSPILC